MRKNAVSKVAAGDKEAVAVLQVIDQAVPKDLYYVFMGFCPSGDIRNRQDVEWREKGICTFTHHDSTRQQERFDEILVGDLIILKKIHQFGATMRLFGHGRVVGFEHDERGHRFLRMDWSSQGRVIETPLLACNGTVDVRTDQQVARTMPDEFFAWLREAANSREVACQSASSTSTTTPQCLAVVAD